MSLHVLPVSLRDYLWMLWRPSPQSKDILVLCAHRVWTPMILNRITGYRKWMDRCFLQSQENTWFFCWTIKPIELSLTQASLWDQVFCSILSLSFANIVKLLHWSILILKSTDAFQLLFCQAFFLWEQLFILCLVVDSRRTGPSLAIFV